MNRDSKGVAITDRAPNQPGGESGHKQGKGTASSSDNGQPPRVPEGTKDTSNTSTSSRKSLKDLAQDKLDSGNASQLGDPISLKAETSDNSPTPDEAGAVADPEAAGPEDTSTKGSGGSGSAGRKEQAQKNVNEAKKTEPSGGQGGGKEKKSLKEMAESNPSMLGDPVSLKNESSESEPTEKDRGAMSNEERQKRGSKL